MVAAAREVTRLRSWASCSSDSNSSCPGTTCSMVVIQQARWVARHTRSRQWSEYASASSGRPSRTSRTRAVASAATSATARLRPFPPGGGTVGPAVDVLVGGPLQVEAADLRRAHAVQREAVLVAAVDDLVGRRRRLGEDAEPAVGVRALGRRQQAAARYGPAGDAVKAVAAGDGIALDLVPLPGLVGVGEHRAVRVEPAHRGLADVELKLGVGGDAGRDHVLDDLGLRVDGDPAAAGELTEVHVVPFAGELEVDAVVLEPLGVEPAAEADLAEQLDRGRFEHPGPLPRPAAGAAPVLDHDGVDPGQGEQVGQEQAGRACPDDADLGSLPDGHGGTIHRYISCPTLI